MSDAPRVFAVVRDMAGIQRALREVAEVRDLSRATIDDAAHLAEGHASKLLCDPPIKNIGQVSLGPLLNVLGLDIWVVENLDVFRRITSHLPQRDGRSVRSRSSMPLKHAHDMRQKARNGGLKGGHARAKKLRPWQRRAIARKAARRRWNRENPTSAESPT